MRYYRLLLRAFPAAFRARFGRDLEELFADLYAARAAGRSRTARARFWWRITADTVAHGARERLTRRRLPLRVHHRKGPSAMMLLAEDLRHAVRALRQQRAVSLVILATLALAIGANSALFTVVNAVLLRPLPYAEPDRIVMLYMIDRAGRDQLLSAPEAEDFRTQLTSITGISPMGTQTANLTGSGEPDRLRAGFVGADFFTMLGVQPIIGRGFAPGEDAPGAAKTAILEYDVWQGRFGGDPGIVGRRLILNNEPHEVIGILPPQFEFPIAENEVWLPISSSPIQDRSRTSRSLMVFGRIADGVSFERAEAEVKLVARALSQAYPDAYDQWSARFEDIHALGVMFVSRNLTVLMGAVGFVLLIACANIANLLLARASTRRREIAVRVALGASRGRIVRQLLAESVMLAIAGGALGLVLGSALTDGMLALLTNLPRAEAVAPDMTVVAFTAAVSIATGLLFGLVPALRTSRPELRATLNEGARGNETRATSRLRSGLVVAELALSLVLLTGAGLFAQSLVQLTNEEIGYDPTRLLTLEYRLPRNKYPQPEEQVAFHLRVVDRLSLLSGVEQAAIARSIPQSGNRSFVGYWRAEDAEPPRDEMPSAQFNAVSSDYFAAYGVPVVAGRVCEREDVFDGQTVAVVNRMLAERLWPGESAIGRRLRTPDVPGDVIVIGVVGNTRPNLLSQPIAPQIYACLSQQPGLFATVVVKTAGEPMALARTVQQAIWSVDPEQPMWKIRTAESLVSGSVQRQRFVVVLMSFAAGLAVLLAGLGTFSVLNYTVQRRAREVGVRMALGATRRDIARLVLSETVLLTLLGIGAGVLGSLAVGRAIAAQLYEVSPRDPVIFSVTALLLAAVALVAAWLPVRRASGVDPVQTLRAE